MSCTAVFRGSRVRRWYPPGYVILRRVVSVRMRHETVGGLSIERVEEIFTQDFWNPSHRHSGHETVGCLSIEWVEEIFTQDFWLIVIFTVNFGSCYLEMANGGPVYSPMLLFTNRCRTIGMTICLRMVTKVAWLDAPTDETYTFEVVRKRLD